MFVSLEDELMRRHTGKLVANSVNNLLKSGLPGSKGAVQVAFARAQANAQKLAVKQRKAVLTTDTWMDEALSFTGVEDV